MLLKPYYIPKPKPERLPERKCAVTVAIAAICKMQGGPAIIAAEDHMITAGDVEFEQPQPKMWMQGPHALALMYGDAAAQAEIAARSALEVVQNHVIDVGEIAEVYQSNLMGYVRSLAEAEILAPLNLTSESFFNRQTLLGPELSAQIISQLQEYYIRSGLWRTFGGAILIGADENGGVGAGHIYKIEYGRSVKLDRIGFAAAGAGQWHAESQFMFSRYTTEWDFPEALSLLITAKKRAEVAPGVGTETDIVLITTNPRSVSHFTMDSPLVARLGEIYNDGKRRHDEAITWQHQEVRSFIGPLLNQGTSVPTTSQTAAPTPTAGPSVPETSEPER